MPTPCAVLTRVDPDLKYALSKDAEEKCRSLSETIRFACIKYLKEEQAKEKRKKAIRKKKVGGK